MMSSNLIPALILTFSGTVTHCAAKENVTKLAEDEEDSRVEYYIGDGEIILPGNTQPEPYQYVVVNKRTFDLSNFALTMETASSDDAANPCFIDETRADLKVIRESISDQSAQFVATKIVSLGEELKNLSTRPTGQKFHGTLSGKAWHWQEINSLILGEAQGETHRMKFQDKTDGNKLITSMEYGLCFNQSCTKSDEFSHEYTLRYTFKKVSQQDYQQKLKYLLEYKVNHPEKCPEN